MGYLDVVAKEVANPANTGVAEKLSYSGKGVTTEAIDSAD